MADRKEPSESPFQTGRRLNSRELVDRLEELRTVRTALTTGLTSQARLRRYQMSASGMQRALGGLIEKSVLFEEAAGVRATVRLQDPFFGVWVRLFVVPLR